MLLLSYNVRIYINCILPKKSQVIPKGFLEMFMRITHRPSQLFSLYIKASWKDTDQISPKYLDRLRAYDISPNCTILSSSVPVLILFRVKCQLLSVYFHLFRNTVENLLLVILNINTYAFSPLDAFIDPSKRFSLESKRSFDVTQSVTMKRLRFVKIKDSERVQESWRGFLSWRK